MLNCWLKDKCLERTLKVADTPDIRRWLLRFGPDAEVVEPAGLREALRHCTAPDFVDTGLMVFTPPRPPPH